jgi:hypothetical protein
MTNECFHTGYTIRKQGVPVQVNKFIRIRIDFGRLDPDLHWERGYKSVSRGARTSHKKVKKFIATGCFFRGLEASPVDWTSFMEA